MHSRWRDSGVDTVLPIWCSGSLELLMTSEHVRNKIHLKEKHKLCGGFLSGSGKGQNKVVHWHPSWWCISFLLLLVFAFHLFLLLFVVSLMEKNKQTYYLKWIPSKNMCNIHTVSPLNCTEKIKMFCFVFFIWKWTFEKVRIKKKGVKERWQKEVY